MRKSLLPMISTDLSHKVEKSHGDDVVVTAVTSAMPRTQTDILLKDWANSGSRVPSTVRLSRLDCLEKNLLLAKLGRISNEDAVYLLKVWDDYIKPQF